MAAEAPPFVPGGSVGPVAWKAAWDELEAGPRRRRDLVSVMQRAGVTGDTATEYLRRAVVAGHLVVVERDAQGRPTLARPEGR